MRYVIRSFWGTPDRVLTGPELNDWAVTTCAGSVGITAIAGLLTGSTTRVSVLTRGMERVTVSAA